MNNNNNNNSGGGSNSNNNNDKKRKTNDGEGMDERSDANRESNRQFYDNQDDY